MMIPITDAGEIADYAKLASEMMVVLDGEECDLNLNWIRNRGWKVVPQVSMARLPQIGIRRLIAALNLAGFKKCVVIFNEPGYLLSHPVVVPTDPPSDLYTCYQVSIDETGFTEINRQLGTYRFIAWEPSRSWIISCNERYNLFAAKPELLEAMLGNSIDELRREFLEVASDGFADESLLEVASRYSQEVLKSST
jgi:hypothetical protein